MCVGEETDAPEFEHAWSDVGVIFRSASPDMNGNILNLHINIYKSLEHSTNIFKEKFATRLTLLNRVSFQTQSFIGYLIVSHCNSD